MTVQEALPGTSGRVPGGTGLWAMDSTLPAQFHLVPFAGSPRTRRLPMNPWDSVRNTYSIPVWEDADHVLLGYQPRYRPDPSAGLRIPDGRLPERRSGKIA